MPPGLMRWLWLVVCATAAACGRTEVVTYTADSGGAPGCDFERRVEARLSVTADNQRIVFVNGARIEATALEWYQPTRLNVALWSHPQRENVIAVRASNLSTQAGLDRGLLLDLRLGEAVLVSDRQWRQAGVNDGGWDPGDPSWLGEGFDDSRWGLSVEQAQNGDPPWGRVGAVDANAKWIWPYLSNTPRKPDLEPVLFRRSLYVSPDGGFSATPAQCR